MTVWFWVITVGLVAAALSILYFGARGKGRETPVNRDQQNADIAREKLEKLRQELADGSISQAQFEQYEIELELALGSDLAGPAESGETPGRPARGLIIAVGIFVPMLAFGLYGWLGNPTMVTSLPHGVMPSMTQLAQRLKAQLRQTPDDARAWFMLGRAYMSMDRYPEAAHAYSQAHRYAGDNADVLLSYADALAMTQGGRMSGKPEALVARALEIEPNNTTGLWLAAMAESQRGDYEKAVQHWRRVEQIVKDDPKTLKEVRGLIAQAEEKLGHRVPAAPTRSSTVAAAGKSLAVSVQLDPSLAKEISPGDTVFVFAKAENGPPMPLAVVRKPVGDLPMRVTLDDSMAMIPAMHLSAFKRVLVGARVSKSGNPLPQAGDLESTPVRAVPGQKGRIRIVINKKVSG
jgi:cytochrome c-type biogenesis protein CcmH